MALRDVTLKVGDTLRVVLDHSGPVRQLELKLGPDGFILGQSLSQQGQIAEPTLEAVELDAPPPPPPPAPKKPTAPVRQAPPAPKKPTRPVIDEPVETVQAVDLPVDDLMPGGMVADAPVQDEAPVEQVEDSPVEVRDESGGELDDADFNLDGDAPAEEEAAQSGDAPLDDGLIEDAPAEAAQSYDEQPLDLEQPADDYGAPTQAPFDAVGATMPPARAAQAEPELDSLEAAEPEPASLSLEDEEQQAVGSASARQAQARGGEGPGDSGELPAWTGRARDYRDPVLETRKAETRKISKKPGASGGFKQDVNLGDDAGGDDVVEAVDIPLEEEEAPVPKKPGPGTKPGLKLPSKASKPPTAPLKAPVKGGTKPVAATKPGASASGKSPAAEGAYTVFLSPPKGADKKQAAAEIIADINNIDIDAAMQLAGKMIVPVAKGVTECEANRVRDWFMEVGLSCGITQKR